MPPSTKAGTMTKKRILNPSDSDIYICQYTKKQVHINDAIYLGPIIPQVNGTYVCHPDAPQARAESVKQFNRTEANCNTCKNLERVPHDKRGGFQRGKCGKAKNHPYPVKDGAITFHPDDHMGMECYEART